MTLSRVPSIAWVAVAVVACLFVPYVGIPGTIMGAVVARRHGERRLAIVLAVVATVVVLMIASMFIPIHPSGGVGPEETF